MKEKTSVADEKRMVFWRNKIQALLKTADVRQIETIYHIAAAMIAKSNS